MKRRLMVAAMVVCMTGIWVTPAFAHHRGASGCRGYAQNSNYEAACQGYCEGGNLCGTDGHYCELHRDGDYCAGGSCAEAHNAGRAGCGQNYSGGCHGGC